MSTIGRFAIFALVVDGNEETIRAEQHCLTNLTGNTIALGFPVHITLKGRFLAPKDTVVDFLKEIDLTSLHLQHNISLSEPRYIEPELSWLEVLPNTSGFHILVSLHCFFEKEISRFVIFDEVTEVHKNSFFCPHITLAWGVTPEIWHTYSHKSFHLNEVQIGYIALVQYSQKWPLEEDVTLVFKIPIT